MSAEMGMLQRILAGVESNNALIMEQSQTLKAQFEILKLILAACEGDGGGELAAVIRKLAENIGECVIKVDALPPVLVEALEQAAENAG